MRTTNVLLFLGAAAAFGCGATVVPQAPEAAAQTPPKTEPVPIQAPASSAAPAAAGGYVTIKGQVKWPGAVPKLEPVNVTANKMECCPNGTPLMPTDVEIDAKTKGLKNVVVWVRPDTTDRKDLFPTDKIHPDLQKTKSINHVIDQPKCQFEPRVLVARTGDTLKVKNSATIPHNINYSSDIESINPLIPAGGAVDLKLPLAAQTTPIPFSCNIHPWMAGRMRVFDHPYFAITDKDGNYEIKNVPAGKWRLVYWHELGTHKGREGALGFPVDAAKPEKGDTMELKPLEFEIAVPKP